MARGTHVGQIDLSLMKALLPKQFLMRYDYDFLYVLLATTLQMRAVAHSGRQIVANSVMEELVLYISVELSEVFMESTGLELDDMAEEWVYEVFGDLDIYTCLYTETYLPSDHSYHYNHWMQSQF